MFMDEPQKHPFVFQVNQEPIKNHPLKIKLKCSKPINGCYNEDSHLQEKDQNLELKSYHGNLKNHLQVDQENRKDTHTASSKTDESVNGGNPKINSERITCQICGKIFPSMKSLFGHMRLHPERQWRGIKPPPTLGSTMVKIDDQQQKSPSRSGISNFDLVKPLKGWSVTKKRGKRGWEIEELDAAGGLLMLVNGNSLDLAKKNNIDSIGVSEGTLMADIENTEQVLENSDLPIGRRNEGLEPGNLEFQCKKPKIDKENENSRAGLNPELLKIDTGLEIPYGFELENTYAVYRIPSNCMSFKSEILLKKFYELGKLNCNQTTMSPNRFNCSICNKSFPSHQALGGHKSGHRIYKNSIHKADVEKLSLVDVRNQTQVDESQQSNLSILKNNVGTHQCKICNKMFPTGQALGGHQRLHRPVPTTAPISSVSPLEKINEESPTSSVSLPEKINRESPISSVSSPEKIFKESSISSVALLEEVSIKMDRNPLDFDLNELPPVDECFNFAEYDYLQFS